MIKSIYILSCALMLTQGTGRLEWQLTPQMAPGLELVYRGTCSEESLIPFVQHQTQYRLEANILILDAGAKDWKAAILTSMSLQDARQPRDKKDGPSSVRLELAHIDLQGRIRGADKKLLNIPLSGPPTLETGFLVPAPPIKIGRDAAWDVGDGKFPKHRWQLMGTESCSGVTCVKIAGLQQSTDWDNQRADQTAWRRRDVIWLHPQLLVAQKVERVIERRDPARDTPTHRTVVRYSLESRLQYPAQLFRDRRQDFINAQKFHDDARNLLQKPALNRHQIDGLIRRMSFHLERQPANQTAPYRHAILHIKNTLEKAQKGDASVPGVNDEPPPPADRAFAIGRRVPDFAVSSLTEAKTTRWQSAHGKPTVVIFFNPATNLGREVMAYAKTLGAEQKNRVTILALAVTTDPEIARKQHKAMGLPFAILDGNAMRLTFGADQTPRFVVLDSDGRIRLGMTGWGFETPYAIEEMLQKCSKK